MALPVPIPSVDSGLDSATSIQTSLNIVDAHSHAPGSGVPITPSGLNINADLTLNGVASIVNANSVNFTASTVTTEGTIYVSGVDLYYNDLNGNLNIQLTKNGQPNGATGNITGITGTAGVAYSPSSETFIFNSSTSPSAGNAFLDASGLILRYDGSYPTPSGNYISIQAPSSLSSGYALTLPSLPGTTQFMTLDSSGNISSQLLLGLTTANLASNANIAGTQIASQTIAQGNLALRATGTTVGAGGVAISAASGSFSTASTSYVPVSQLSVTITTTGRPVMILLQHANGEPAAIVGGTNNASAIFMEADFNINRDSSSSGSANYSSSVTFSPNSAGVYGVSVPPSSVSAVDIVTAGTHTYILQARSIAGTTAFVENCSLVAYEL